MSDTKTQCKWFTVKIEHQLIIYKKAFTPLVIYPILLKAVSVGVLSLSSRPQTPAYVQGTAALHPCTNSVSHTHHMYIFAKKCKFTFIHNHTIREEENEMKAERGQML